MQENLPQNKRKTYRTVNVDEVTYERLKEICKSEKRHLGAQVQVWVDAKYKKLQPHPEASRGK